MAKKTEDRSSCKDTSALRGGQAVPTAGALRSLVYGTDSVVPQTWNVPVWLSVGARRRCGGPSQHAQQD
jgi:hypothetical protein